MPARRSELEPGGRAPRVGVEGRRALALVAGGLAFAVTCVLLDAWRELSIGRLHVQATLALVGLAAVVAGGVDASIAIVRERERSAWVCAAVPLALLALLALVSELALDVP